MGRDGSGFKGLFADGSESSDAESEDGEGGSTVVVELGGASFRIEQADSGRRLGVRPNNQIYIVR